jgi:integrase
VRIAYSALHTMLNHAVEDELIGVNPASKLGRSLKLLPAPGERQARVKAMDREQLRAFLGVMIGPDARPADRRYYPFFLTLARTGLRIGEAFALEPGDIDFTASTIRVERAFSDGRLEATPKTVQCPSARWICPLRWAPSSGRSSPGAARRASVTGGRHPGSFSPRPERR